MIILSMRNKEKTRTKFAMYESLLLVKGDFGAANASDDSTYAFLAEMGSKAVIKVEGKRSLSYPIQGFETAIEKTIVFTGNDVVVKEMVSRIKKDDTVLRAITKRLPASNNQDF